MPASAPALARYDDVRAIALAEMFAFAGDRPVVRRAASPFLRFASSALARRLVGLDHDLARTSIRDAALETLRRYGAEARLERASDVVPLRLLAPRETPLPREGPLVIVANHPGIFDALALFAAAGRDDLATLAARRPLLEALPNLSRRLLAIDPGAAGAVAVKRALQHLRGGGALLHFPAGRIEPDPRVAPPGSALLEVWKPGLDVLLTAAARACPGLSVAAAVVSGVMSRRALALASAFSRALGREGGPTDALVPLIQLTFPGFTDTDVRVRFGPAEPPRSDAPARLRAQLEEMAKAAAGRGSMGERTSARPEASQGALRP